MLWCKLRATSLLPVWGVLTSFLPYWQASWRATHIITSGTAMQLLAILKKLPELRAIQYTVKEEPQHPQNTLMGCFTGRIWPVLLRDAFGALLAQMTHPPEHLEYVHFRVASCAWARMPPIFGRCSNLTVLDLGSGREVANLATLPDLSRQLTRLRLLRLSASCSTELPRSFTQQTALHTLVLQCKALRLLPPAIRGWTALQQLHLGRCASLAALPETVGELTALHRLVLADCTSLTRLPDSLGRLIALEVLGLKGCRGLLQLPDTIGDLQALQELHLKGVCESRGAARIGGPAVRTEEAAAGPVLEAGGAARLTEPSDRPDRGASCAASGRVQGVYARARLVPLLG